MIKKTICIIILVFFFLNLLSAEKPVLTMVYKSEGKPPFIGVEPNNSGLYLELLTIAANRIGCDVAVKRGPKKRMYQLLEKGEAEIYVRTSYEEERASFLYLFPNGIYKKNIVYWGLTNNKIPYLNSIDDFAKYDLTWMVELGSSNENEANEKKIKYIATRRLYMDELIKMLTSNRNIIVEVKDYEVTDYMKNNKISVMEKNGIRIQKKIFSNYNTARKDYFMAFSRFSPYYKEIPNPNYKKNLPQGPKNYPIMLAKDSIPDKLQNILKKMIANGEVEALLKKYNVDLEEDE